MAMSPMRARKLLSGQDAIDLHARAADGLGDGGRRGAFLVKLANPVVVETWSAAAIGSSGLRPFDSLALSLLDEPALHLRHHAENGQHQMPHLTARRHMRIEHSDERTFLLALVDQVAIQEKCRAFDRLCRQASSTAL